MKQFIRNFRKQRIVGLLNISSLSLGIMVAIVIGLWAINELSFDRFHTNNDRIYRSVVSITLNGNPVTSGAMFRPFGEMAKDELPVIEDMCRVFIQNNDITIDNNLHTGIRSFIADANFFTFFTFPLKDGDLQQVLSSPDKVVISESAARRYFSEQNPVGQILKFDGQDFAVSGVMKDMPKNSSLQTDFVFPLFGQYAENNWGQSDGYVTFFLLQKDVLPSTLEEPLTQLTQQKYGLFKEIQATFILESLADIHFESVFFDPLIKGNKSLVMVFILTALVILVISCINFANLFVSTSFIRAKTIGIKKAVGAKKLSLMREFYMETACYVLLSTGIGLALVNLIMPIFNNFTQSNLTLDFSMLWLYIFLAGLFVFVVLLAGSFPALYMTRFNVIETLAGKFKGKKMSFFQKSLVVTQFTASIVLLTVVAFMLKQVNHIISYNLGFDKENVLYVKGRDHFEQSFKSLEGEFLQEPTITNITRKTSLPTDWTQGWGVMPIPQSDNAQSILMEICRVSPNYFDFFGMKIIDGENPFFLESSEETDVLINESAARLLGYEQPVGEMITAGGDEYRFTIRGVVHNAYTKSLHKEVDPQVYFKMNDGSTRDVVFFKISGDPQRAISLIEQKWKEREADYPFEYHFLDDTYQQLYTSEVNSGKVLSFAMLITLIITVAGLFAMAYYATQRRVREIAIRKVYGATKKDIFVLLNKDFMLWVVISYLIACPIAYYGLYKWLEGFVVKTSLSLYVFLLVGTVAFLVALLTTGFQTWKAATANPVEAIKRE